VQKWEKDQLAQARASFKVKSDARLGTNGFDKAPRAIREALVKTWKIPPRPSKSIG
jgi:hypothetical protein